VPGDVVPRRELAGDRAGVADDVGQQALCRAVAVVRDVSGVSPGAGQEVVQLRLRVMQAAGARPAVGSAVHRRRPVPGVGVPQRSRDQVQCGVPVDLDERIGTTASAGALQPGGPDSRSNDAVGRVHRTGNRAQQGGRVAVRRERLRRDEPIVLDARVVGTPVRAVDGHARLSTRRRTALSSPAIPATTAAPKPTRVPRGSRWRRLPPRPSGHRQAGPARGARSGRVAPQPVGHHGAHELGEIDRLERPPVDLLVVPRDLQQVHDRALEAVSTVDAVGGGTSAAGSRGAGSIVGASSGALPIAAAPVERQELRKVSAR
jgi:hypothetical protein